MQSIDEMYAGTNDDRRGGGVIGCLIEIQVFPPLAR